MAAEEVRDFGIKNMEGSPLPTLLQPVLAGGESRALPKILFIHRNRMHYSFPI